MPPNVTLRNLQIAMGQLSRSSGVAPAVQAKISAHHGTMVRADFEGSLRSGLTAASLEPGAKVAVLVLDNRRFAGYNKFSHQIGNQFLAQQRQQLVSDLDRLAYNPADPSTPRFQYQLAANGTQTEATIWGDLSADELATIQHTVHTGQDKFKFEIEVDPASITDTERTRFVVDAEAKVKTGESTKSVHNGRRTYSLNGRDLPFTDADHRPSMAPSTDVGVTTMSGPVDVDAFGNAVGRFMDDMKDQVGASRYLSRVTELEVARVRRPGQFGAASLAPDEQVLQGVNYARNILLFIFENNYEPLISVLPEKLEAELAKISDPRVTQDVRNTIKILNMQHFFDRATAIPNANYIHDLARAYQLAGEAHTLGFGDLNYYGRFKDLPDGIGIEVGDNVMRVFIDTVNEEFRSAGVNARLGRYAGDEFILVGLDKPEVIQKAMARAASRLFNENENGPIREQCWNAVSPATAKKLQAQGIKVEEVGGRLRFNALEAMIPHHSKYNGNLFRGAPFSFALTWVPAGENFETAFGRVNAASNAVKSKVVIVETPKPSAGKAAPAPEMPDEEYEAAKTVAMQILGTIDATPAAAAPIPIFDGQLLSPETIAAMKANGADFYLTPTGRNAAYSWNTETFGNGKMKKDGGLFRVYLQVPPEQLPKLLPVVQRHLSQMGESTTVSYKILTSKTLMGDGGADAVPGRYEHLAADEPVFVLYFNTPEDQAQMLQSLVKDPIAPQMQSASVGVVREGTFAYVDSLGNQHSWINLNLNGSGKAKPGFSEHALRERNATPRPVYDGNNLTGFQWQQGGSQVNVPLSSLEEQFQITVLTDIVDGRFVRNVEFKARSTGQTVSAAEALKEWDTARDISLQGETAQGLNKARVGGREMALPNETGEYWNHWNARNYGTPPADITNDNLFRGYLHVNPEQLTEALTLLDTAAKKAAAEGSFVGVKFLVAREPRAEDATVAPKTKTVGNYKGLEPGDPVIAVYCADREVLKSLTEALIKTDAWQDIEEAKLATNPHGRKYSSSYFDSEGREWRSIAVNLDENGNIRAGHAEDEVADLKEGEDWRDRFPEEHRARTEVMRALGNPSEFFFGQTTDFKNFEKTLRTVPVAKKEAFMEALRATGVSRLNFNVWVPLDEAAVDYLIDDLQRLGKTQFYRITIEVKDGQARVEEAPAPTGARAYIETVAGSHVFEKCSPAKRFEFIRALNAAGIKTIEIDPQVTITDKGVDGIIAKVKAASAANPDRLSIRVVTGSDGATFAKIIIDQTPPPAPVRRGAIAMGALPGTGSGGTPVEPFPFELDAEGKPTEAYFKRIGNEVRTALRLAHEEVSRAKQALPELQEQLNGETNPAKRQRIREEIARDRAVIRSSDNAMDLLVTLQKQKKMSPGIVAKAVILRKDTVQLVYREAAAGNEEGSAAAPATTPPQAAALTDEDHVSGVKELALALGLKRAGEIDTAEKADRVLEVIQGRLIQAQQDVMTGLVKPRKGEAEAWGELFSPENLAKLSSSDWVKLEAIISRGNVEMVKQEGYGFVSGLVGIFGMEKVANALGIKNPALHFITVVGGSHVLSSQLVPHLLSADKFQALVKFAKAGPKTWFLGAAKELISTNWARFSLSLAKGIVHFGVAMQVYDRITRLLNVQDTAAGGAFGRLLGGQTVMSAVHVTWGMALRFAMTRLGASAARLAQSGGGAAAEALTGAYLTATVVDFIKSKVTYEGSLDAASGNDPLVRSRLVEERVKGADDAWQTVRETVRRRLLTQAVAKVNDAHTDASYFQGVSLKDFDLDGLKADLTSTVTLTAADQAIMDFIPEYLKANPKASQENVVAALAERFTSNEETVAASLHRIAVYQLQQNLAFVYETDPTGRHIHEAERQMLNSDGTVKPEMFEGFMTRMVGELKQSREADIVTLRRRVRVETLMTEEHAGSTHFTRADMEAGLVDGSTLGLNLRHGWVVDFQSFQYAELKKEAAQLGAKTALTAAEQNRLSQIKVALTAREIQIIQLRRRFLMTGDAGAQIDLESLGDDLKWLENKPYVAHLKQMGEKIALAEKMPEHVRAVYLAGLLEQLAGK